MQNARPDPRYVSYRIEDDGLIVSDLRMGMPDHLAFQFQFAQKDSNNLWQTQIPTRVESNLGDGAFGGLVDRLLGEPMAEVNHGSGESAVK